MGYQKIAQRNPKTGVQKNFKKILWGKSYTQIKVFGSMRVPLGIFFKICTDILLDKPSIFAEETLLCTDV